MEDYGKIWFNVKKEASKLLQKNIDIYDHNHPDANENPAYCGEYCARLFHVKSRFLAYLKDSGYVRDIRNDQFFDICFDDVIANNINVYGFIKERVMKKVVSVLESYGVESQLVAIEKCQRPIEADKDNLEESILNDYPEEEDPEKVWKEAQRNAMRSIENAIDKFGMNPDMSVGDMKSRDKFYVRIQEISSNLVLFLEDQGIGNSNGRFYDIVFDEIIDDGTVAYGYVQEDALKEFVDTLNEYHIISTVEEFKSLMTNETIEKVNQLFDKIGMMSEKIQKLRGSKLNENLDPKNFDKLLNELKMSAKALSILNENEVRNFKEVYQKAMKSAARAGEIYLSKYKECDKQTNQSINFQVKQPFSNLHENFAKYLNENNIGSYQNRNNYNINYKSILPKNHPYSDSKCMNLQWACLKGFQNVLSKNGIRTEMVMSVNENRFGINTHRKRNYYEKR